jgi:16S rRNA (cytidine1402-2'-O)-methyltransferase
MADPNAQTGGRLLIVSTPIGNLEDITLRAIRFLRESHLVLAEDTRTTRKLLDRYEIATPMLACHEHNEATVTPRALERLRAGESVALVSDAGTPLLSDPGRRLVSAAIEAGIQVVPIPGPSALLPALVASGLDSERFTFLGFLARKGRDRSAELTWIAESPYTVAIYESPHRLADTLRDLAEAAGADRPAAVARELTKLHEEVRRGTLAELSAYYSEHAPRGEIVVVVGPRESPALDGDMLREQAAGMLSAGMSPREVARTLTADFGAPRNLAYRLAHQAGDSDSGSPASDQ